MSDPTLIPVFVRSVYGVLRTYPADARQAIALRKLTSCATLEARHVEALRALGFTLTQVQDPKACLPCAVPVDTEHE